MGMPEDVRRKILDPFFTTKAGAGTGLGVPQVDAFVRRAGGFMSIATAIGVGSTFDLFFPYDGILGDARQTISHVALTDDKSARPVDPPVAASSDVAQRVVEWRSETHRVRKD